MDIFAIANEGLKIQEQEIKDKAKEEAEEAAKKKHKLDIHVAMANASAKNYGWYGTTDDAYTAEEKEKGFAPFMLNLWMGCITPVNTSREITAVDLVYYDMLSRVNSELNTNVFNASKGMNWLLACTVNTWEIGFNTKWISKAKREAETKYDNRVIKYMAKELWSSEDKIYDMIEGGLISDEDMLSISADLDTLEEHTNNGKVKKK